VASYDEDTTTMGIEAARLALRSASEGAEPDALWFATATPAYLE
jgi:3-hydroxy-3-methylglutaryl CoA synthase